MYLHTRVEVRTLREIRISVLVRSRYPRLLDSTVARSYVSKLDIVKLAHLKWQLSHWHDENDPWK